MTRLRIGLAQIDPTVGDLQGNVAKILDAYDRADSAGCDLVAFPELAITGYPPEDLVLKPSFIRVCMAAVTEFAKETKDGPGVILGSPWSQDGKLYNAALLLADGAIASILRDTKTIAVIGAGTRITLSARLVAVTTMSCWLPLVLELSSCATAGEAASAIRRALPPRVREDRE